MRDQRKPAPTAGRGRKCRTCARPAAAGALIGGDCPSCIGQMPLPLRGEAGRFLSFTGQAGPGAAGADGWAAENLTRHAQTITATDPTADSPAGGEVA